MRGIPGVYPGGYIPGPVDVPPDGPRLLRIRLAGVSKTHRQITAQASYNRVGQLGLRKLVKNKSYRAEVVSGGQNRRATWLKDHDSLGRASDLLA